MRLFKVSGSRLGFGVGDVVFLRQGVGLAIKRSRVRFPARARLRNDDSGQVVHTHVPRFRQFSLLCGVVKPGTFTLYVLG